MGKKIISVAEAATYQTQGCRAEATVISNLALQHMKAAVIFSQHASRVEDEQSRQPRSDYLDDVRSYVCGCVILAGASVEALINELFLAHDGGLRIRIPDFERAFWGHKNEKSAPIERRRPLRKYKAALELLGAKPMPEQPGSAYENMEALFQLRNWLVHYKPNWDPGEPHRDEFIRLLTGRYRTSAFVDEGSDFLALRSMSGDCCRWSVSTSLAFISEFGALSGLLPEKFAAFHSLKATSTGADNP